MATSRQRGGVIRLGKGGGGDEDIGSSLHKQEETAFSRPTHHKPCVLRPYVRIMIVYLARRRCYN